MTEFFLKKLKKKEEAVVTDEMAQSTSGTSGRLKVGEDEAGHDDGESDMMAQTKLRSGFDGFDCKSQLKQMFYSLTFSGADL